MVLSGGKYMKLDYVKELWSKLEEYKENAEQHEFVKLMMLDSQLVPAYNDLINNYNEEHADIFIRVMENKIFPMLGIK